jgi:hypothetical protein
MTDRWNRALRSAFAPARELEPTEDEVQHVLAIDAERNKPRSRQPLLRRALAACAAVAIASGAYAVPATRAALDDVYSAVTGWVSGDDEHAAPGRALNPGDDAPAWIRDSGGDKRLVAANGSVKLYAVRNGDKISFALGGSVGLTDSVDGWRHQLEGHRIVLLGPGAFAGGPLDEHDRRPLFGLTARSVTRVELRYDSGPPTTATGLTGGFALLADARRAPRELVAYDRAGEEVERLDVSRLQLRICHDMRGCPPGKLEPPVNG